MINGLVGLHRRSYLIGESQGSVISDSEEAVQRAVEVIRHQREELGLYIREFKEFQLALDPLEAPKGPRVAKLMAEHSKVAGVGPITVSKYGHVLLMDQYRPGFYLDRQSQS